MAVPRSLKKARFLSNPRHHFKGTGLKAQGAGLKKDVNLFYFTRALCPFALCALLYAIIPEPFLIRQDLQDFLDYSFFPVPRFTAP
jgi:hypothetical protein